MHHSELGTVREEPGPVSREDLTDSQWLAIEGIFKLLQSCAFRPFEVSSKDAQPQLVPQFDNQRWNQVFLIEGGRSSGKTATLLTLLDALSHWHTRSNSKARPGSLVSTPTVGENPRHLSAGNVCFIPLDVVNMRQCRADMHLALSFVGTFANLAHELQRRFSSGFSSNRMSPSSSAYKTFRDAVSLGMATSVPPAVSGEILMHEIELQKVEAWRREVLPSFRRFVDALCEDYRDVVRVDIPLFIIPIEDADMVRTTELLDLMTTFSHPRVAYVFTGDRKLLIHSLTRKFVEELGALEGESSALLAMQCAEAFLAKTVPYGQTFQLAPSIDLVAHKTHGPEARAKAEHQ